MGISKVVCPLPMADLMLLESARAVEIANVFVGDGRIDERPMHSEEIYSVSALALDVGRQLFITAESVDLGARAEAFRLRVFDETALYSKAVSSRMKSPIRCPSGLDLSVFAKQTFRPAILRSKEQIEAELIPGTHGYIELITDAGLILLGPSGAMFLIEHDFTVPLNLRVSTSTRVIKKALSRASAIVTL